MIWAYLDRLSNRDIAEIVVLAFMVGLFAGYVLKRYALS